MEVVILKNQEWWIQESPGYTRTRRANWYCICQLIHTHTSVLSSKIENEVVNSRAGGRSTTMSATNPLNRSALPLSTSTGAGASTPTLPAAAGSPHGTKGEGHRTDLDVITLVCGPQGAPSSGEIKVHREAWMHGEARAGACGDTSVWSNVVFDSMQRTLL